MGTRRLLEIDSKLVQDHIQANIVTALAGVSTDTADFQVTLEAPRTYFWYPRAAGYQLPAVFIIAESMDLRKADMAANHINGLTTMNVTVLIEDRVADFLVVKAFRYMNALHEVLDLAELTTIDGKVKLFIKVTRIENSSLYANTDEDRPDTVFRKEVMLALEIEHIENF